MSPRTDGDLSLPVGSTQSAVFPPPPCRAIYNLSSLSAVRSPRRALPAASFWRLVSVRRAVRAWSAVPWCW